MSITEMKTGMERLKITVKHIVSKTGLDRRTVKSYLDTGLTRSVATEQAIINAYRELVRERSSIDVEARTAV